MERERVRRMSRRRRKQVSSGVFVMRLCVSMWYMASSEGGMGTGRVYLHWDFCACLYFYVSGGAVVGCNDCIVFEAGCWNLEANRRGNTILLMAVLLGLYNRRSCHPIPSPCPTNKFTPPPFDRPRANEPTSSPPADETVHPERPRPTTPPALSTARVPERAYRGDGHIDTHENYDDDDDEEEAEAPSSSRRSSRDGVDMVDIHELVRTGAARVTRSVGTSPPPPQREGEQQQAEGGLFSGFL